MQIKREQYSSKETLIFAWVLPPYTLIVNLLIFGSCIFSSLKNFLQTFCISLAYVLVVYSIFGVVAIQIKKRLPEDHQLFRRIGVMLPVFYLMNALMMQGIYLMYENIGAVACQPMRATEWWVTGYGCIASTVLTFVNEAAAGWDKWKNSVSETGRLQNAYHRSRLLGLKRQINPHFLFNCFNTLSSLIQEDEKEAEKFLDEITRVYRYLLKGDDEQLVELDEELKFIDSYLYLNKIRFGKALDVHMYINDDDRHKKIPPLSLQVVLDNIIYRNAFSKSRPITIEFYTNNKSALVIKNTLQPKPVKDIMDYEEALDNLVSKYKLLFKPEVEVYETATHRMVLLPLIAKEEVPA